MAREVQKPSLHTLVFRSLKRTPDMLVAEHAEPIPWDEESHRVKRAVKLHTEYDPVLHMPTLQENLRSERGGPSTLWDPYGHKQHSGKQGQEKECMVTATRLCPSVPAVPWTAQPSGMSVAMGEAGGYRNSAFVPKEAPAMPKPQWHPPWNLYRVISGHVGWVRCIAVEPGNQWFATGSSDRTIKIWDLASGKLKLSLTGHIGAVRGVTVSTRSPHLFSCGECTEVKCWDLEYNKVIRDYHGHLSAVYGLDLHPTIDVLVTCGRDSTARVWDVRTKISVYTLSGHRDSIATVKCQAAEPQIITGSHDTTIRLWDLVAGRTRVTLTNHKKSTRTVVIHPRYYTFASGSPGNIKQWKLPDGDFIQNLSGHSAVINTLAVNSSGVLVSGAGDGSVHLWDWRTGYNFQRLQAAVQPGSLHSDSGIFACVFDHSGSRLLTAEADKTIKVYKEDDTATEETHPVT